MQMPGTIRWLLPRWRHQHSHHNLDSWPQTGFSLGQPPPLASAPAPLVNLSSLLNHIYFRRVNFVTTTQCHHELAKNV